MIVCELLKNEFTMKIKTRLLNLYILNYYRFILYLFYDFSYANSKV